MKEPHPSLQAGSRKESVRPGTSPEPAPARAVMEDINSRDALVDGAGCGQDVEVGVAGLQPIPGTSCEAGAASHEFRHRVAVFRRS
jgi:hypothetical protein